MRTIWKYQLPVADEVNLKLPVGAQILCVQVQNEVPCIWAEVEVDDPDDYETEPRAFRLYGTGHSMWSSKGEYYIGTFQLHGGALVFHVYEIGVRSG